MHSLHMAINDVAGKTACHVRDILREFLFSGSPKNLKKTKNFF